MCATQRPLHWKQSVVKKERSFMQIMTVTDYIISENDKT